MVSPKIRHSYCLSPQDWVRCGAGCVLNKETVTFIWIFLNAHFPMFFSFAEMLTQLCKVQLLVLENQLPTSAPLPQSLRWVEN